MLSPAQLDARRGKLTASRVSALMSGDAAAILRLYMEMIGEIPEPDLSDVWAVQLGTATESLNLQWYCRRKGRTLLRYGEVVVHPLHDWAACTLDAWDPVLGCPVETKHVGGREPLEVIIERYWPQLGWQMFVTDARKCAISVIMGANEPIVEYIERDDEYILEMFRRGEQFMSFVARRIPPVVLPPVPAPLFATKAYDFSTNNLWAASAFAWIESKPHAEKHKDAEKTLKSLVPADARKCFGAGVRITRDRANRLSLRENSE